LGTHVLLPDLCLSRRQDEVSVIGMAIEAKVAGSPEFRSWWARGWALRGRKPLWGLGFEGL